MKQRLARIEKLVSDFKPKETANPYEDWTTEQLRNHWEKIQGEMKESESYKKYDSMTLDELLKMWEETFRTGEIK